jgi:hypothetical protein
MPVYINPTGLMYQDVAPQGGNDQLIPYCSAGLLSTLTAVPDSQADCIGYAFVVNTAPFGTGGPTPAG